MTKEFITTILILGMVGMVVGVVVKADTTADVSATVTAELISVSVLDGSVAYGILAVNISEDTVTLNDTQVVTNDSNVLADLGVKSSDAVGGTQWNLAATNAALDDFTHESSPDGSNWTLFNADNSSYTTLGTGNIAASGGTQNLDLRIKTPTSVTDNILKTITVTVLATASQ